MPRARSGTSIHISMLIIEFPPVSHSVPIVLSRENEAPAKRCKANAAARCRSPAKSAMSILSNRPAAQSCAGDEGARAEMKEPGAFAKLKGRQRHDPG